MGTFKSLFLGSLSVLGAPKSRAVILMYHSISASTQYFMNVKPADFEWQMAYVAGLKRPVISCKELLMRLKENGPLDGSIVITFDDGYRDNFTNAFPVLKEHGFHATVFVETSLIARSDKRGFERLNPTELIEMESSGLIDIQPHSCSHPRLSTLDDATARDEIVNSKSELERILGHACDLFAYPYGDYSASTKRIAAEAGIVGAFSVTEGTVGGGTDLLAIPRVSIDTSTNKAQFAGKVSRAVDAYEYLKSVRS